MVISKNATSLAQGIASVLPQRLWYAVYSAAALVLIQVGIGIVLKAAQTDNHYAFSPSSSVTISEFLKMLLAIGFFYREWAARVAENAGRAYLPISTSDDSVPLRYEMERPLEEYDKQREMGDEALQQNELRVEPSFLTAMRKEVSTDIAFGLGLLSLFYVLINNLVFVSYQVADPATISLTKSGVTCITALVLMFTLDTKITGTQWLAIVLQYLALSIKASCKRATPAYMQAISSCTALCINASILPLASLAPLNPNDEADANAIVKCLATAIATAILIFLSPIFFGTTFNFLIVPGSIVVFGASWLYAMNPTPKPNKNGSHASNSQHRPWTSSLLKLRKFYLVLYGIAQLITLAMIAAMSISSFSASDAVGGTSAAVTSPFEKTLAFVRWNGARPERIPHVMKYKPFFHTMHISMPNETTPGPGLNKTSLTEDAAKITPLIYRQVALTLQVILDTQPEITGLFYFHFDSWIDPLAWSDMNLENVYFPFLTDKTKGPFTICMSDTAKQDWWGWDRDVHQNAMNAASAARSSPLTRNYTINDREWCLGWSDIYYIPRRFFQDYIRLSDIFSKPQFNVFHEVAIPTIVHIIDNSHRKNPHIPVVNHISDCWGDCCSSNPSVDDVLRYPCGHRLDYLNKTIKRSHPEVGHKPPKLSRYGYILGSARLTAAHASTLVTVAFAYSVHLLEILGLDKTLRHFCSKAAQGLSYCPSQSYRETHGVRWMLAYFKTQSPGREIKPGMSAYVNTIVFSSRKGAPRVKSRAVSVSHCNTISVARITLHCCRPVT
ncbi:PLC-like phosphodiesterase, TIM beta/alpha-barrel domain protein [Metarhizium robertsii ARSEF 23]|uniref:PLC-like phosphodiesterase, TIM beta/alpha-barrel domain protein n=1 Tax=Metarhizium robertsii (strain ARSEF 23 / ATCC MYA-3075) TaxID=655844 RepID=A0A0B2XI25_METRA|nr:PLC-like phosphodiesterase, TIM beta/alpha-barrel domain protein [Metarhizium robertsii ARSEF 23]KHO11536.1 PLC-like phosphodiesterase, TIM beta/alpha-barrel domain protein [Metarhizium robertsii ARSEF 23]